MVEWKKSVNIWFSIIVLFILGVLEMIFLYYVFLNSITPTYIQQNNIIQQECEQNITYEIELIAREVSNSHEYKLRVYDCTQFSESLVDELKKINVSSYCVFGYMFDENGNYVPHTWVMVDIDNEIYPIEATGGYFISKEDFNENYKILNKGYCL